MMRLSGRRIPLFSVAISAFGLVTSLYCVGGGGLRADEPAAARAVIPLWPEGVPDAKGNDPEKDVPTLTDLAARGRKSHRSGSRCLSRRRLRHAGRRP